MNKGILQASRKGRDQNFLLRVVSKRRRDPTYKDTGIRADRGFRVGLSLGEMTEEVIVQDTFRELK